jgi:hypothetical protein
VRDGPNVLDRPQEVDFVNQRVTSRPLVRTF